MAQLTATGTEAISLIVQNVAAPDAERPEAYTGSNALRLILHNQSGRELALSGASSITCSFTRFNKAQSLPKIAAADRKWTPAKVDAVSWRLVRDGTDVLGPDQRLSFDVTDLQVDGPVGGMAHIVVKYDGIGGLRGTQIADPLIQSGPSTGGGSKGDSPFAVFEWVGSDDDTGNIVYATERRAEPIQNTLVLAFGNPTLDAAATVPRAGGAEFYLSFMIADDVPGAPTATALTTFKYAGGELNDGKRITITADDPDWMPTEPTLVDSRERQVWRFKPSRLLAPNQTVRLIVRNICLPHGNPAQPSFEPDRTTYMFLQYVNVPDCADGYLFLPIHKQKPHRAILRFFNVTPDIIEPGDPVTLCWQTIGVARLELTYDSNGQQTRASDSVDRGLRIERNTSSYTPTPPPTKADTHYFLRALNASGALLDKRTEAVEMIVPSIVAGSFNADPPVPLSGRSVRLQWKTQGAANCTLRDSTGALNNVTVPLQADAHQVTPAAPTVVYELTATRRSKSVSERLTVTVQPRVPAGFPVPPFAIEETFEPVIGTSVANWVAKLGIPGADLTGQFNPGGNYVDSVARAAEGLQEVVISGSDQLIKLVWYVALSGLYASTVDVRVSPDSGPRVQGWSGHAWNTGPAANVSGTFWYRKPMSHAPPFKDYFALFAKTYRSERNIPVSEPPFRMWVFRA